MRLSWLAVPSVVMVLVGCGNPGTVTVTPAPTNSVTGRVLSGQTPVVGATVQLYTVGASGDGSAALALLAQTVTTDASGNFALTANGNFLYSCANATEIYAVATGGSAGAVSSNSNLALMTALGSCSSVTTGTSFIVNEVTTVAAVAALGPYMTSASAVGSGSTDATALATAFGLATEFANNATGLSPGTNIPSGYSAPATTINTLADAVVACDATTGGVAGDGSNCGKLFTATTPTSGSAPTNTLMALLNLEKTPTLNTSAIYALGQVESPFQPELTNVPPDFRIRIVSPNAVTQLQISPASLTFPATAVSFTSQPMTVTITNSGTTAVSLGPISLTGPNVAEFAQTNNCPVSLAAGSSCAVLVTATPIAAGLRSGYLSVVSSAGDSPQYAALSVTGIAPSAGPVTLTPATVNWTIADTLQDLTLSNLGSTALNIKSVAVASSTPSSSFAIANNNCGTSLPAQSVCTISVVSTYVGADSFGNPTSASGVLTITDDASAGPQSSVLNSANGGYFSVFASNPGQVVFPANQVGYKQTATTLVYTSNSPYSVGPQISLQLSGANSSDFSDVMTQGGPAVTQCQPQGSNIHPMLAGCYVSFSFTPSAAGVRSAKAVINSGSQYLLLTGTGVGAGPSFRSSASSFSTVEALPSTIDPNSLQPATATITNDGSTTLSLVGTSSGANATTMSYSSTGCASLAPQASCTVSVQVNGITPATDTATLKIADTNSSFSQTYPVTGNIGYWNLSATPNTYNFGSRQTGTTSAAQTFQFGDLNYYPIDHPITASLPANSNFVITSAASCAASTTQLCPISVAFSPHQTGAIQESLTATDQTSQMTYAVILQGTGGAAMISFNQSSLSFPLRSINTTSVPMGMVVTNAGTIAMSGISVSVTGAVNNNFTETDTCAGQAIQVNGTCTINVTFAPTAPGSQSATVVVTSNASNSPASFGVSGSAQ